MKICEIPDKGFTHGGKFHSDDVFSSAFLQYLNPKIEIVRGFEVPDEYDGIVYDIGGGIFDHHQIDKEYRENGVPYAAFGLLFREFGEELLGKEDAERFAADFIEPLDESDNTGCSNVLAKIIAEFNPGWDSLEDIDSAFFRAVAIAKEILTNHFESVKGMKRAEKLVTKAIRECDGRILILPQFAPWKELAIKNKYLMTIFPSNRGGYGIQGVPVSYEGTELRCSFPREWRGLEKEKLQRVSGISTLRFCHPAGFLAMAETFNDALLAAEFAVSCQGY